MPFFSKLSPLSKTAKTRLKRIFFSLLFLIGGVFLFIILFISPLAKYLIERFDEKYTGRDITLDWAYVNPFTGYVYLSNVKIYEPAKDTLFLSAAHLSADFALMKMFSGTYEVTSLTLNKPQGIVIQNKKSLNFDDLILRFSPDSLAVDKSPSHVNILNINIEHGDFIYRERVIPIYYIVKDLNLKSTGKRWDVDTLTSNFSFLSQNGKGGIKGSFTIDVKSEDFRLAANIRNFDLELVRQYLWELINYGMFSAELNASIEANGNLKNPDSLNMKGRIRFKDFHLGKTTKDDYFAFKDLVLVIDELSPMHNKFLFDSVILDRPFFKYEKFDSLNNVEMLFGKNGSNISDVADQPGRFNLVIEVGRYLKKLTRNFFQSEYRVNRLAVKGGNIRYSDFSLSEQFSIETKSLSIHADSIDKRNKRIHIFGNSGISPYGKMDVQLSINPKDSGDFDMIYNFDKVPLTVFNPYLVSYTSYPLDRGTIDLKGVWNVRNGDISSSNHLFVTDPRASSRLRNKNIKWIPLPFIMALVRERGNVIDYNVPISGNLKNPHFHLSDVVLDIIKNIFVKPVTLPYGVALKNTEEDIENALTLRWAVGQQVLEPDQSRFLEKMATFLAKNSEASISVVPKEFAAKEREHILFFEAKKKYFLAIHGRKDPTLTTSDSLEVAKMSVKDRAFVHVLKRGISDTVMFTIQEKCMNYVGPKKVNDRYARLLHARETGFRSYFKNNGTITRLKIHPHEDTIPFNGFSYFDISYKGDIPKSLRKAYEEMRELNNENPRRKGWDKKDKDISASKAFLK